MAYQAPKPHSSQATPTKGVSFQDALTQNQEEKPTILIHNKVKQDQVKQEDGSQKIENNIDSKKQETSKPIIKETSSKNYVPDWRKKSNDSLKENGSPNSVYQNNSSDKEVQGATAQNNSKKSENFQKSSTYTSKKQVASFEEAIELVQKNSILTYNEYKEKAKQNKLPLGLPAFPAIVYKDSGWKNWAHFLGTVKTPKQTPAVSNERAQNKSTPVGDAQTDQLNEGTSHSKPPHSEIHPEQSHLSNQEQEQSHSSNQEQVTPEPPRQVVSHSEKKNWDKERQTQIEKALKVKKEREALYQKRKLIAEELKTVKLDLVFDALGNENGVDVYGHQDGDKNKWKIAHLGNIITKGQTWQNTMTFKKGFGGISLVMMTLDKEFGQALDWMIEKFGDDLSDDMKADLSDLQKDESILFSPPDPEEEATGLARKYLIEKRGIPPSLVDREIKKGLDQNGLPGGLYGAHPLDNHGVPMNGRYNVIFRGPASAEVRGIEGSDFKGCLGGSLPEHSGYRVPHAGSGEPLVAMTEAAIDALSYHALFPSRFVISTNGSGSRFPLQYKLAVEMVNRDYGIRAAFDADSAGDFPAQRLCNAFILRKILMHKLKVDEDQVDEWFLNDTIEFIPSDSPHENCFNLGWHPQMAKFESHLEFSDEKQRMVPVWVDTGTLSPPVMKISIKRDIHPEWTRTSEKIIPIGEKAFSYIMNDLNIRRDRPLSTKDWNEELKELGPSYIQKYEKCAKTQFKTLPELPTELAHLREDTDWVFTSPPPTSSFQPKR